MGADKVGQGRRPMEPSPLQVDDCIYVIARKELEDMPVGSTVMVKECIGFKKMGWWWRFRFWLAGNTKGGSGR